MNSNYCVSRRILAPHLSAGTHCYSRTWTQLCPESENRTGRESVTCGCSLRLSGVIAAISNWRLYSFGWKAWGELWRISDDVSRSTNAWEECLWRWNVYWKIRRRKSPDIYYIPGEQFRASGKKISFWILKKYLFEFGIGGIAWKMKGVDYRT